MNRIKSKQNISCMAVGHAKLGDRGGAKTRNQSRQVLKQKPNNPQKSGKKNNMKNKEESKPEKIKHKTETKQQPMAAELYYEKQVMSYINQEARKKFKQNKTKQSNKLYVAYRQNLIKSVYQQYINLQLKAETFYLYVYFLDSFMRTEPGLKLNIDDSVMASYASFLMAQKYEEIYPPSVCEWLPAHLHDQVYKWEGKIIFALNFKLIHESLQHFFDYWSNKYELKQYERKTCQNLLQSILFNYELLYKYEPQKIAKAVVMIEAGANDKKTKYSDLDEIFDSKIEKNRIIADIAKHIIKSKQRIEWISNFKK